MSIRHALPADVDTLAGSKTVTQTDFICSRLLSQEGGSFLRFTLSPYFRQRLGFV